MLSKGELVLQETKPRRSETHALRQTATSAAQVRPIEAVGTVVAVPHPWSSRIIISRSRVSASPVVACIIPHFLIIASAYPFFVSNAIMMRTFMVISSLA